MSETPAGPLPVRDEDTCPFCGTSLIGEPIPASSRSFYGKATHFRRETAVESDGDRISYCVCPDCHRAWPEFAEDPRAAAAIARHDAAVAALADLETVREGLTEHAQTIAFALGLAGLRWRHWSVDPKTGATLYLLVEQVTARASWNSIENARQLAVDATGLPIAISNLAAPGADERLRNAHPAPIGI